MAVRGHSSAGTLPTYRWRDDFSLRHLHRPHQSVVRRENGLADRRTCPPAWHCSLGAVPAVVGAPDHRGGPLVHQRGPDRFLHCRERALLARLHTDARGQQTDTQELVLHADRQLVSRASHLSGGEHQYSLGVRACHGAQPLVAVVYRLRRRGDGVVRRHRILHHGERPVLAGTAIRGRSTLCP
jgi:hypothetical protein